VPAQAPTLAVSVWPSTAVPEIVGGVVLEGALALTIAVAVDVLLAEPAEFVVAMMT
jgi:hypothetical protein